MNLTNENMQQYVGGQLEIVSREFTEEQRWRGQIAKIEIIPKEPIPGFAFGQDADLCVEFEYLCLFHPGEGYKPDKNEPYHLSLNICGINDIGYGRICISCRLINEMIVFYPPTHDKRVLADGTMEINDDV